MFDDDDISEVFVIVAVIIVVDSFDVAVNVSSEVVCVVDVPFIVVPDLGAVEVTDL